ncbi:arginase [Lichenifustis flavocetrariae]|uniref:Arginase n=1 Tax=Lichenifustis flavocetrariae TaxID=2949735 RepID=A0AA41Z0M4_9HYPH|nr:arginase [Lichenifustis flavocetrariae]MCW6507122.1 arginase [Lichenifustis flavocetrariae]
MIDKRCILIGVPVQEGTGRLGCDMGPSAFRAAGIVPALADLGFEVVDRGNVLPGASSVITHPNPVLKHLGAVAAWTEMLADTAYQVSGEGLPIFLGGDHSLSAGTMTGMSRRASREGRDLFVLWLDSHPDLHTLDSTTSGNLHGVPMAYATGQPGFAGFFPPLPHPVRPENVCMIGLRSVDPAEGMRLREGGFEVHDMRAIDENGIVSLIAGFLRRVTAANGMLHVSLDVDFLDPGIAPGVGTTVPGGATFREAHLAMEMLHDSGLVRSLDLVELNPFLDERGRTAILMVDLAASLMGRRVLDRPTRSF